MHIGYGLPPDILILIIKLTIILNINFKYIGVKGNVLEIYYGEQHFMRVNTRST